MEDVGPGILIVVIIKVLDRQFRAPPLRAMFCGVTLGHAALHRGARVLWARRPRSCGTSPPSLLARGSSRLWCVLPA